MFRRRTPRVDHLPTFNGLEALEPRVLLSSTVIDASDFFAFNPVNIGGGGFIQEVVYSEAERDVRFAISDVGGAFRWDAAGPGGLTGEPGRWEQMVRTEAFGFDQLPGSNTSYGVEALATHPTDPDVVLLSYGGLATGAQRDAATPGNVYRSDDGGRTFTAGNLAVDISAGDTFDKFSKRLAFDPLNAEVVYYGSFKSGLYRSTDGGRNFGAVAVPGAPGRATNAALVAVDPSGGTVVRDGRSVSARVYAATRLGDVFQSTDGGATFANISDGTAADGSFYQDIDFQPDGTVFLSENYGGITRLPQGVASNGWRELYPDRIVTAAVDPTDPSRVFAMSDDGELYRSTNGGESYDRLGRALRSSPDIPWLAATTESYFSTAQLSIDPFRPDRLTVAQGIGVWNTSASQPTEAQDGDGVTWVSDSVGIEMMVARDAAHTSAGVVVAAEDRTAFLVTDPDETSAQVALGLQQASPIANGSSVDTPDNDRSYVAAVSFNYQNGNFAGDPAFPTFSGYSTDGGVSWQRFGSITSGTHPAPLAAGNLAVSNRRPGEAVAETNLVWLPKDDYAPFFSTDNGLTWQQSASFDALDTRDPDRQRFSYQHGHFNSYVKARTLVADPVDAGTFYLYLNRHGVWSTTDGGATWTQKTINDAELPEYGFHAQLAATPGRAGDLWFASGRDAEAVTRSGLWHSRDGGDTWDKLPGWGRTLSVSLGAAAAGATDPTLYASGVLDGRQGVYRSTNLGNDWQLMAEFPAGLHAEPYYLSASPTEVDKLYVGVAGYGFVYSVPDAGVPLSDVDPSRFAVQDGVTHQAEAGTPTAGLVSSAYAGSDGAIVDYQGSSSAVTWGNVAAGGLTRFDFRYANGSGGDRTTELVIDGVSRGTLAMPTTGGWTSFGVASLAVELAPGSHEVRLRAFGSAGPNLDSMTVTPADAAPIEVIQLEAEDAALPPGWVLRTDGDRRWIEAQPGAQRLGTPLPGDPAIRYGFDVATAGMYDLFALVQAPSAAANSLWISLDGGAWIEWSGIRPDAGWRWSEPVSESGAAAGPLALAAGSHELRVMFREGGTRLDKLVVQAARLAMPVGAGYTATPGPERVQIGTGRNGPLTLQAEDADADPAWVRQTIGSTTYRVVPNGSTPSSIVYTPTDATPRVRFRFDGAGRGDFRVAVSFLPGPTAFADDSFFARVNGGAWQTFNGFSNANPATVLLNGAYRPIAGSNLVEIAQREDGLLLDRIEILPV